MEYIYGPYDSKSKFIPYILKSLYNNIPEISLTLGEQQRDFVYITDVISAYIVLIDSLYKQQQYCENFDVGSGQAIMIRDVVEMAHQLTGSLTKLKFGDIPYRENETMQSQSDIVPMKSLGWSPSVTLFDGLNMVIKKDFIDVGNGVE